MGAPALDFAEKDLKALYAAAGSRGTYQAKAAVTVANAPFSDVSSYQLTPWPFLRDMSRILDLIPVEATQAPSVTYYRGTTAASAAAAVAEGANKPESSPVWTEFVAPVRKLAHYTRVNDEVIEDFPGFRNVIGNEMIAGLVNAENDQLLNGDGVAPNLTGLLVTTGILTRPRGTDTHLDAIAKAMNDLRVGASFTEADIVVMNPADWSSTGFVLPKDTTGQYITGNPIGSGPTTLWNARVVVTTQIAAGTAMVANLKEAARAYVRQVPTLDVAPLGGGTAEFIANQTLIRAEERLALAVVRPTAIVKVTF